MQDTNNVSFKRKTIVRFSIIVKRLPPLQATPTSDLQKLICLYSRLIIIIFLSFLLLAPYWGFISHPTRRSNSLMSPRCFIHLRSQFTRFTFSQILSLSYDFIFSDWLATFLLRTASDTELEDSLLNFMWTDPSNRFSLLKVLYGVS